MSEYKHGEMDITEQKKAYAGFIKASIWVTGLAIGALVFMAVFNS